METGMTKRQKQNRNPVGAWTKAAAICNDLVSLLTLWLLSNGFVDGFETLRKMRMVNKHFCDIFSEAIGSARIVFAQHIVQELLSERLQIRASIQSNDPESVQYYPKLHNLDLITFCVIKFGQLLLAINALNKGRYALRYLTNSRWSLSPGQRISIECNQVLVPMTYEPQTSHIFQILRFLCMIVYTRRRCSVCFQIVCVCRPPTMTGQRCTLFCTVPLPPNLTAACNAFFADYARYESELLALSHSDIYQHEMLEQDMLSESPSSPASESGSDSNA